jgi:hypothetical protein
MERVCSTHGPKRNAYRTLIGKPEEKRPLEKYRRMWKDNIKTDLREIGRRVRTGFICLSIGTNGKPS